jgi:hypothetical protein
LNLPGWVREWAVRLRRIDFPAPLGERATGMIGSVRRTGRPQRLAAAARQRSAALVLTLVLALIGAPATSALRNECELCPRTCPMHRNHDTGAESGQKMHCHPAQGAQLGQPHHASQPLTKQARCPSFGRPNCGNHGTIPATVLPPVVLSAALMHWVIPTAQRAPVTDSGDHGRAADPPDTPPPIAAA